MQLVFTKVRYNIVGNGVLSRVESCVRWMCRDAWTKAVIKEDSILGKRVDVWAGTMRIAIASEMIGPKGIDSYQ